MLARWSPVDSHEGGFLPCVLFLLLACARPLSMMAVSTPNRFNPLVGEANPLPPIEAIGTDRQFLVPVGPPKASISVSSWNRL